MRTRTLSRHIARRMLGLALGGAVALSVPCARAEGAALERATTQQKKDAAKSYAEGMRAMQGKKLESALAAFRQSYDTVRSPNSLLMVGRVLGELGRFGQAWDALQQTAREADDAAKTDAKYAQTSEAAHAELEELKQQAGFVVIKAKAGTGDRIVIEGQERTLQELGEPIAVTPGSVEVVLVTASGQESAQRADVQAGATVEVDFAPPAQEVAAEEGPAASAEGEASTTRIDKEKLAYIAGGVGAAGLLTFAVFGALNNAKYSDLQDACSGNVCPRALEDDADTGQTYQTVANVGLVIGVIGVGTGVTLFVLSRKEKKETSDHPAARVRVGAGTISLSGHF